MVVAASDGNELEAAELLAAVGLQVRGFLGGGMSAWRAEERPVSGSRRSTRRAGGALDGDDPPLVVDVRNAGEFEAGHIPGSVHIPYPELAQRVDELPRDRPVATICRAANGVASPPRSCSARGSRRIVHVSTGGVPAWRRPRQAGSRPPRPPRGSRPRTLSSRAGGGR